MATGILLHAPSALAAGTAPFTLTAKQQMDEQNRYKFNVELNAIPDNEQINQTVDAESGKSVKEIMTYIIVVDDVTKTRLEKATSIDFGGRNYPSDHYDFKNFWTKSNGSNAQLGENTYVESGLWFHRVDQSELPATFAMPTFVWHNVYPTAAESGTLCNFVGKTDPEMWEYTASYNEIIDPDFKFTVHLTCADKWGDNTKYFPQWDLLNFEADEASTKVVAPITAISLGTPYLQKSNFKRNFYMFHPLYHPDGGRLSNLYKETYSEWVPDPENPDSWDYIQVTHQAGDHNEKDGPKDDDPVYFDFFNESVVPITIDALNVSDEVLEHWSIQYDISITPAEIPFDPVNIRPRHRVSTLGNWMSGEGMIDPRKEQKINAYDLDLSPLQGMKSLDGRHNNYIDGRSSQLTFEAHLKLSYVRKNGGDYDSNVYYLDNEPKTNTLSLNYPTPTVTQRKKVAFSKYKAQYYDDPMDGGGGSWQTLDYLAHATVGFDINGYSDIDLYPYMAFDAQQKLYYCDEHNGVYREPHNAESHPDCQIEGDYDPLNINDPNIWWKLNFAGTRAANGGHPVDTQWDSSVTDIVPALKCSADEDGDAIDYIDYQEYIDGSAASKTDPCFNWSRIAARSHYLPLHINPVKRFSAENFETDNTLNNAPDITAKFAVVFPLVSTTDVNGDESLMPIAKISDENQASKASGRLSPDRDIYFYVSALHLVALPTETKINFSDSQITGVDEIIVDHPDFTGDAEEYYNLQGIRVTHPAKGQIYIMRHGGKSMKILY